MFEFDKCLNEKIKSKCIVRKLLATINYYIIRYVTNNRKKTVLLAII